jgi:uncharacterized caspase-like protein
MRRLDYADDDANEMCNILTDSQYGGFKKENVALLTNRSATLRTIRKKFTWLERKCGKEDTIVIFYSGHGASEPGTKEEDGLSKYLFPYDGEKNYLYATSLPMGEIEDIFKRLDSERIIFLIDCCYSGAAVSFCKGFTAQGVKTGNMDDKFLKRIAETGKGRIILTASRPNEVSFEHPELKHGVLTYYLIEALKGKADKDKDRAITITEVYDYIYKKVEEKSTELTGLAQHPQYFGSREGKIILTIIK